MRRFCVHDADPRDVGEVDRHGVAGGHRTRARIRGIDACDLARSPGAAGWRSFETAIARHPEVVECYTMAGIWDYVLKIVTRDIAHYESFARNTLLSNPFIGELHSHIAVTEIKNSTELPIETQL